LRGKDQELGAGTKEKRTTFRSPIASRGKFTSTSYFEIMSARVPMVKKKRVMGGRNNSFFGLQRQKRAPFGGKKCSEGNAGRASTWGNATTGKLRGDWGPRMEADLYGGRDLEKRKDFMRHRKKTILKGRKKFQNKWVYKEVYEYFKGSNGDG